MIQFLQTYGIIILLGIMLAVMLSRRGHGSHGMGCGMGCGGEHETETGKDKASTAAENKSNSQHSGGCH